MSDGKQWEKNLEESNKRTANEKQTAKSRRTTNVETSEVQQTHLTKN
jgi:hypothetical protein